MTSPLHVAVVTETWPPEVNGVAMTLGRMVQGLLARGHRVSLTRPRQHAYDMASPAPRLTTTLVRGLPIPGYAGLKFGLPARRLLCRQWRAERPDVVQVVTEGPLGASAIAAARELGIPVRIATDEIRTREADQHAFPFLKSDIPIYGRVAQGVAEGSKTADADGGGCRDCGSASHHLHDRRDL